MSGDLVFGVQIKNSGDNSVATAARTARDEFVALKESTDAAESSAVKLAGGYSKTNDGLREHALVMGRASEDVSKLIGKTDAAESSAVKLAGGYSKTNDGLREHALVMGRASEDVSKLIGKTDAAESSAVKLAGGYSKTNDSLREHALVMGRTSEDVSKLIDKYDPLGAKLRQLQADFNALDKAASSGNIGARDDARVEQVYASLQKQINATRAAAGEFGDASTAAMGKATLSTGQLRMATQQLPMQFTDIWVSLAAGQSPMTVMLQQGSQLKDSFGGVGAAAKAMGSYILGMVNPVTITAASFAAAGVLMWESYGSNIARIREEFEKLDENLGIQSHKQLSDRYDELGKKIQELRAKASEGGWGWNKIAEEARVYEEEQRKIGKQIDDNRALEEKLGNAGGVAAALAHTAATQKQKDIERQIELLVIYRDHQQAGSQQEINAISKIAELRASLEKKPAAKPQDNLLAEAKRMDEQMLVQHEDAFTRQVIAWKAMEDKLIAAGKYGAEVRAQHEAAYTQFVNEETVRRTEASKKQLEKELADENAYFAQLTAHENARLAQFGEVGAMMLAYKQQNMEAEITSTLSYFEKLSSYGAAHSKGMFEINKAAGIAKALVSTYVGASKALEEGGIIGPVMATAVTAMGMAQVAAIQGTTYGGSGGGAPVGGGGGVPSLPHTPSAPTAAPAPTTLPTVAAPPKEINIHGLTDGAGLSLVNLDAFVRDRMIPALNQAGMDGYTFNYRGA